MLSYKVNKKNVSVIAREWGGVSVAIEAIPSCPTGLLRRQRIHPRSFLAMTQNNDNKKHLLFQRIVLCLVFLFIAQCASSQVLSTKGKDFWLGFMENVTSTPAVKNISVLISSDVATSGSVSVPLAGWSTNFTVAANAVTSVEVPYQYMTIGKGTFATGVHVVAQDSISLFASNYHEFSFDATVVIPTPSLGKEYRAITYRDPTYFVPEREILVVAAENNTQFEILMPQGGSLTSGTLSQGQVYQYQSDLDLTGAIVRSTNCTKIAVFAGNICTYVPDPDCKYCDHLYEEMFPLSSWGKNFILPQFQTESKSLVRVVAHTDSTVVTVNNGNGDTVIVLSAGSFYQYLFDTVASYVTSTKPVAVAQFALGSQCEHIGDPFFLWVNPIEQGRRRVAYAAIPSNVISNHYVNVVIETAKRGSLVLNGAAVPLSSFTTLAQNPAYAYARLNSLVGANTLSADGNFTANVYGLGNDESYGYSAGSDVKNLATTIDNTSPLCAGTPASFTANVPPEITLLTYSWNFGDGATSLQRNTSHNFISGGNYAVKFYFTYAVGTCPGDIISDSIVKVITVNAVTANAGPDTSICFGSSAELHATGGTSYVWSPTFGLSDPNISNPVASPTVTTTYTVIISAGGCVDSDHVIITVLPLPVADAGADTTLCSGDSIKLSAKGGGSYLWRPSTGLSDSTSANPFASPDTTTTYSVIVTTNSCSDTDEVVITVTPRARYTLSTHTINFDTMLCNGIDERKIIIQNVGARGADMRVSLTDSMFSVFRDSFFIAQGGVDTIIVRFHSLYAGTFTAHIIIGGSCAMKDTIIITGVKLPTPQLSVTPGVVIIPEQYCGITKDTVVTVHNPGSQTITIERAMLSDTFSFTIISPKGKITLQPGDSVMYTLRFLARNEGRNTTTFTVYGSPCNLVATVIVQGSCVPQPVKVFFPHVSVPVGTRMRIPLTVMPAIQSDFTEFTVTFSYDSSVIFIYSPLPQGTATEHASIFFTKLSPSVVRFTAQSDVPLPKTNELIAFDVEGLYGPANETILRIDLINFKNTLIGIEQVDGSITVTGCEAGQFSRSSRQQLFQNSPNPFSSTTVIGYRFPPLIKNGKFIVTDMLGTILFQWEVSGDERQVVFNAHGIPAGTYLYSLISTNGCETRMMTIMK